jgi:Arc/MetJ-type ribon-helix-helix transcriptional regulator
MKRKKREGLTVNCSVRLTRELVKEIDKYEEKNWRGGRSGFIRYAIARLIQSEKNKEKAKQLLLNGKTVGEVMEETGLSESFILSLKAKLIGTKQLKGDHPR